MDTLISVATEFFKTGNELHVKQLKELKESTCQECDDRDGVIEALQEEIDKLRAKNKCLEEDVLDVKASGIRNTHLVQRMHEEQKAKNLSAVLSHRRAVQAGMGIVPCACVLPYCVSCQDMLKPGWVPGTPAPPAPSEPAP